MSTSPQRFAFKVFCLSASCFRNMASLTPPYPLSSSQAKTRVSVCGYHRRDFDLAVTWFSPHEHTSISGSIATTFREPTTCLAILDTLPLELVHTIILQMDLRTFFHFRQINLRARQIVDQLHEYKVITAHAMDCICALLRTGAASHVTVAEIYHCFCTDACSICKERYGNLVQLLTWTRCCSTCLAKSTPELCVTSVTKTVKCLDDHPKMRTLPGVYSMEEKHYTKRIKIMPTEVALKGNELDRDRRRKLNAKPYLNFMACCALPTYCPAKHEVQTGVSCAGCQLTVEVSGGSDDRMWELRNTVYSHDDFARHLEWCEPAQVLWNSSNSGAQKPAEMPHFCQTKGYFVSPY
ncbi:hypothetical protein LTR10_007504 [Elasticomyces elasticus]|nr:hypothetical protein LTR10_007504 [Elasticomyces elasticus]KAK4979311.1 hypothetical protein LTR42_001814 [Elasticomyces elasticus]